MTYYLAYFALGVSIADAVIAYVTDMIVTVSSGI